MAVILVISVFCVFVLKALSCWHWRYFNFNGHKENFMAALSQI